MSKVLKAKRVSYGLVELIDTESAWSSRYVIQVNGSTKEQSSDLTYMTNTFNNKYH